MIVIAGTEYTCKKHEEEVVLVSIHGTTLVCVHCMWKKIDRLRDYNRNLVKAIAEERRLRGAAQRVIGKLMTNHVFAVQMLELSTKTIEKNIAEMKDRL